MVFPFECHTHVQRESTSQRQRKKNTGHNIPIFCWYAHFCGVLNNFLFPTTLVEHATQYNSSHPHQANARRARCIALCVCVFVCFLMVLNSNTQPPSNVSCKFGSVYTVPRMFVALAFFCMYVCIYACKRLLASIYDSC